MKDPEPLLSPSLPIPSNTRAPYPSVFGPRVRARVRRVKCFKNFSTFGGYFRCAFSLTSIPMWLARLAILIRIENFLRSSLPVAIFVMLHI